MSKVAGFFRRHKNLLLTKIFPAFMALFCLQSHGACAQIQKTTLGNGMTVILKETQLSDITACSLLVKAGTRMESESTSGYTRFLQNVLAEGQGERSRGNMETKLAFTGGFLNLDSTSDFAEFTAQAATDNINDALDVMEKVAFHPAFTQKEIEELKNDFLESIKKRGTEAFDMAYTIFLQDFYADGPYAKSELGTKESMENVTVDKLMAFYNTYYVPNNMVLSCAGNFKMDDMEKQIDARFEKYSAKPLPAETAPTGEAKELEDDKEETRSMDIKAILLFFGFSAPRANSEDYIPLRVINAYLGAKGGPTELSSILRDRLRVAEDVWSFYPLRKDASHFVCAAITYPYMLDKAESALLFEIAKLKYEGIEDEKLGKIKTYLVSEFLMDHENAKQQSFYLGFFELLGMGYEYDEKYVQQVQHITSEDIKRASQKYFTHFVTIVLNPKEEMTSGVDDDNVF